ncbi:putative proline-rich protein 18-like [Triplophysa rosa]|uniref:Proline-rich protein 18-like n=1 Tax=Triplophysa rosa TaxID=992332 RepID=A0A9W7X089_TRIRA|nr:putative proline-rich protein 18-like [Triplophysa rosa]
MENKILTIHHLTFQSNPLSFLSRYSSKTDFLTYVLLYLVKMPFPPVTRPQGLPSSGKEKPPVPSSVLQVKIVEEKSYVRERQKKLSKKATPHKSKLPTSRATAGLRLEGKSAWITSPRPADPSSTSTAMSSKSSSGISVSPTNSQDATASSSKQMFPANQNLPQASSRCSGSGSGQNNSEAMNSVSLTPEATLLLQKRSREKQLRAIRSGAAHQRKDPFDKSGSRSNIPIMKISLLNDRHRYDDVEYEEEVEQRVVQNTLLKCSEWLRGVENAAGATTLGRGAKICQKTV